MRDGNNLIQPFKHLFTFKRGINATRREKEALFLKQTACSCLLSLPKNLPAIAAYPVVCTSFECWRRRVTKGKTEVVEAMERERVWPLPYNRPAVMTAITTTLSKKTTHLHQLHVPRFKCLKKKKARELRWWLKPLDERECDRPAIQQRWKRRKKPRLRKEPCHQNLL